MDIPQNVPAPWPPFLAFFWVGYPAQAQRKRAGEGYAACGDEAKQEKYKHPGIPRDPDPQPVPRGTEHRVHRIPQQIKGATSGVAPFDPPEKRNHIYAI